MAGRYLSLVLLVVMVATLIGMVAPGFADGDDPPTNPGDPSDVPPGAKTKGTRAGTFSDVWMILMAMAFQFAF
jgi:hypothetical protein